MSARLISAVFPGKCPVCGTAYAKGAPIYFDKAGERGRKAWCREHGERPTWKPEPAPAPLFEQLEPTTPTNRPAIVRTVTDGCAHLFRFESLVDFGRYVLTAQPSTRDDSSERNRRLADTLIDGRGLLGGRDGDGKWSGLTGSEWRKGEALATAQARLYSDGWPRGLSTLQSLIDSFQDELPPPRSVRRRRSFGDQGDSVDMGRVWSGDLSRAWSRTSRAAARGPGVVTIYINPSIPWKLPNEVAFWRCAAGVALSDVLTRAGYSVEIYLCVCMEAVSADGRHSSATVVLAKPASAPLDVSALAAMCSPSATRCHGFAAQSLALPVAAAENCGSASSVARTAPALLQRPNAHETPTGIEDEATARAWIAARIAELENPEQAAA